ncbi:tetratricopeptide repeat protein [bacterium]|nr:tetratricopeptide repeat protein [bacterium]
MALTINPNHSGVLHGLGIWYAEASNFYPVWSKDAHDYLNKALKSDQNNSMIYVTLARLYIREKRFAEARKLLQKCLGLNNPTVPAEYYNYSKPESQKLLKQIEGK